MRSLLPVLCQHAISIFGDRAYQLGPDGGEGSLLKTGNVLGLMAIDLNCEDGAKLLFGPPLVP